MLADMVPKSSAQAQFLFSAVGVVIVAVAIVVGSEQLIGAGASFLFFGALAFVRNIFYMINFK
jgi:hypothetical protein